jgi:hypothetical protein
MDHHPELDPDQDLATHAANIGRRRADQVVGLLTMLDAWRHTGTRPSVVRPMMGSAPAAYNGGAGDYSASALSMLV